MSLPESQVGKGAKTWDPGFVGVIFLLPMLQNKAEEEHEMDPIEKDSDWHQYSINAVGSRGDDTATGTEGGRGED